MLRAVQSARGRVRHGIRAGGFGAASGGSSGASESWDPARLGNSVTLSNGNFTSSTSSGGQGDWAQTGLLRTTGKLYFEVVAVTVNEASFLNIGVIDATQGFENDDLVSGDQTRSSGGQWSQGGGAQLPASFTSGDVLGFAVDFSTRIITGYKNNVQLGISAAWTVVSAGKRIGVTNRNSATLNVATIRTGTDTLQYAPPTGYIPWAEGS